MSRVSDAAQHRWALEEVLSRGEPAWFTARGNSMLPLLFAGSRVRIAPCRADALTLGDVALCRMHGALVLHRLVKREQGVLWMRGDNQRVAVRVAPDQVLGRLDAGAGPLPAPDARAAFRRLGARRVPLAMALNRGFRLLVRAAEPLRRRLGWPRRS